MKTKIVRIGNSRGVRIPKALLDQLGLTGTVTLTVEGNRLVIQRARHPREGWAEAFKKAGVSKEPWTDDWLNAPLTRWDKTEWKW